MRACRMEPPAFGEQKKSEIDAQPSIVNRENSMCPPQIEGLVVVWRLSVAQQNRADQKTGKNEKRINGDGSACKKVVEPGERDESSRRSVQVVKGHGSQRRESAESVESGQMEGRLRLGSPLLRRRSI